MVSSGRNRLAATTLPSSSQVVTTAADRRRRTGSQMPEVVSGDSTVTVGSGSPSPPLVAARKDTPWMRASRCAGE